jgi:hypothetical protein
MKKMIVLCSAILALGLTACSSGGGNGGGGGTGAPLDEKVVAFEKETAGTWLSECQQNQDGFYKETLVIGGGKGSSQLDFYQNQNCGGQVAKKQAATEFTYTAGEKVNGATKITMTIAGQQIGLTVVAEGNLMTVNFDNGKIARYNRTAEATPAPAPGQAPGQAPAPAPGNGQQGGSETAAIGLWVDGCTNSNGGSFRQILQFQANGRGSFQANVYQQGNCGGEPQAQEPVPFTYKMEGNGKGSLNIGNESFAFTIQDRNLSVQTQQGQLKFTKVN